MGTVQGRDKKNVMKPTAGDLKELLKEELRGYPRYAWNKGEIQLFIEEVYSNLMERYLED